jgi:chitodextrinase
VIELTWKGADKASGYEVKISADKEAFKNAGKEFPHQPIITEETNLRISDLVCGEAYTCSVRSFSRDEGKPYYQKKDAARTKVKIVKPDVKVSGIEIQASSFSAANVLWKPIDISGAGIIYNLSWAPETDGEYSEVYGGSANSFTLNGLSPETEYFFKVSSTVRFDGKEFKGESEPVSFTAPEPSLPAVEVKAVARGSGAISILWDVASVSGEKISYIVQRSTQKDGKYAEVYRGGKTSFYNSGLVSDTKYWYKVLAVCSVNGKEYRSVSKVTSVTTGYAPAVSAPVRTVRPRTVPKPKPKPKPEPIDIGDTYE